ncbi:serine/threonine protein phosphatase [Butyrivibrio sp. XB500-5]|uniref:metallophosphoesterase n=1 Tax=Butyrivibrio sp. XB500-5 TaxID=2364880 RepID=UPI000EAA68A3|nr:metallophosphoesterase [Butyrivibrio sp. XB500-5]RKM60262.1 serine/threonine protein phosphatase [Butyrivibrio sp. XB500-5]
MATYVISDLHGQYKMFLKLLEKVAFSDADELYMLGDAVDRGPDGIKILQHVMNSPNMHFLLGNHEVMMLEVLDPRGSAKSDISGYHGPEADRWLWWNGGDRTFNKYKRLKKEERVKLMDWLYSCPLSLKIEVNEKIFLLTHTAFLPDKINIPFKEMNENDVNYIVWNSPFRPDLYKDIRDYIYYKPWTFIIGHVPACYMADIVYGEGEHELSSFTVENVIDIDGGCASGGRDNKDSRGAILLRLDDMKEFTITFAETDKG